MEINTSTEQIQSPGPEKDYARDKVDEIPESIPNVKNQNRASLKLSTTQKSEDTIVFVEPDEGTPAAAALAGMYNDDNSLN